MSHDDKEDQGQVSEVASLDPDSADTPISDDQSTAGQPDDAAADAPDVGPTGPNAKPDWDGPGSGQSG